MKKIFILTFIGIGIVIGLMSAMGSTGSRAVITVASGDLSVVEQATPQVEGDSEHESDAEAALGSEPTAMPIPWVDRNCIVTIGHTLVDLSTQPRNFSSEIGRVPPRSYIVLDRVESRWVNKIEGWFEIQLDDGRQGWIKDNSWTLVHKSDGCLADNSTKSDRDELLDRDEAERKSPTHQSGSTECIITIGHPLVTLSSEPRNFGPEIGSVPPKSYIVLERTATEWVGSMEGWLKIELDSGQQGWVRDDWWTLAYKSNGCSSNGTTAKNEEVSLASEKELQQESTQQYGDTECTITIDHSLATLSSEPRNFSSELGGVPSGSYPVLEHTETEWVRKMERWIKIELDDGRQGWIKDDFWHVDYRTEGCP